MRKPQQVIKEIQINKARNNIKCDNIMCGYGAIYELKIFGIPYNFCENCINKLKKSVFKIDKIRQKQMKLQS